MALLAWRAGDITMIELKKYLQIVEIEARISENEIAQSNNITKDSNWYAFRSRFLQKCKSIVFK